MGRTRGYWRPFSPLAVGVLPIQRRPRGFLGSRSFASCAKGLLHCGCRLPIGHQARGDARQENSGEVDRSAAFKVADDRAVAVIAPPREVVDVDYAARLARHPRTLPDHAQQRIVADRKHQPLREACSRSAAQREPKVLDDMIETIRPAGSRREDAVTKALREDLVAAENRIAPEAPDEDLELDASAAKREVLWSPVIPALDPLRDRPTIRTWTGAAGGPSLNNNTITFDCDPVDHQSHGNQAGWPKCLLHRADSSRKPAAEQPLAAAKLNQTHASVPIHSRAQV